jgi:hypothetical protein
LAARQVERPFHKLSQRVTEAEGDFRRHCMSTSKVSPLGVGSEQASALRSGWTRLEWTSNARFCG